MANNLPDSSGQTISIDMDESKVPMPDTVA